MIRSHPTWTNSDRLKILANRTIHNSLSLKKDRTAPQTTNNCLPHYHQSIQTKQIFSQCLTKLAKLFKKNTMAQNLPWGTHKVHIVFRNQCVTKSKMLEAKGITQLWQKETNRWMMCLLISLKNIPPKCIWLNSMIQLICQINP